MVLIVCVCKEVIKLEVKSCSKNQKEKGYFKMINFIIYEEDKHYIDLYESLIHKFMVVNNDTYKIYKYSKYSSKIIEDIKGLIGYNIYIFDIEVHGKSGLDLAKEIRRVTDFAFNQIILVTSHTDLVTNAYHQKLLMIDFLI